MAYGYTVRCTQTQSDVIFYMHLLLYGLEACPLNITINSNRFCSQSGFFVKLFKTNDITCNIKVKFNQLRKLYKW